VPASQSRHGCPVALLVVSPDESVARWAAQPIETGHPDFILKPLVVGPSALPIITDLQTAAADPEMAVLSAMAHGHEEAAAAIADATLRAVKGLEDDRARLYADLVWASLGDAARQALEQLMQSGQYEYQSDFARKYYGEGRSEGRWEAGQEMLLDLLMDRGFVLSAEQRQRVADCKDPDQLRRWHRRAAVVASLAEVFAPENKP
jgi:hypothetical protein